MAIADSNSIIRAYLATAATLTDIVGDRIYCPRLEENTDLPAVSFFTRSGISTPYIPGIVTPSVQFDCWASSPIGAREVYNKLYDNLQGIQNQAVGSYMILSAIEEIQGQDLVDSEIQNYFRVLCFFNIMLRVE